MLFHEACFPWAKGQPRTDLWDIFKGIIPVKIPIRRTAGIKSKSLCLRKNLIFSPHSHQGEACKGNAKDLPLPKTFLTLRIIPIFNRICRCICLGAVLRACIENTRRRIQLDTNYPYSQANWILSASVYWHFHGKHFLLTNSLYRDLFKELPKQSRKWTILFLHSRLWEMIRVFGLLVSC